MMQHKLEQKLDGSDVKTVEQHGIEMKKCLEAELRAGTRSAPNTSHKKSRRGNQVEARQGADSDQQDTSRNEVQMK